MANILVWMQLWCIIFALFVSITSFSKRYTYPENVQRWTNTDLIWNALSLLTIVVGSIALFELYRSAFGGVGGSTAGGGGGMDSM